MKQIVKVHNKNLPESVYVGTGEGIPALVGQAERHRGNPWDHARRDEEASLGVRAGRSEDKTAVNA